VVVRNLHGCIHWRRSFERFMKSLFHAFPKTLGEDFLHIVSPASIRVAGSKLIMPVAPDVQHAIDSFANGIAGVDAIEAAHQ
jgi:hypothetical protein